MLRFPSCYYDSGLCFRGGPTPTWALSPNHSCGSQSRLRQSSPFLLRPALPAALGSSHQHTNKLMFIPPSQDKGDRPCLDHDRLSLQLAFVSFPLSAAPPSAVISNHRLPFLSSPRPEPTSVSLAPPPRLSTVLLEVASDFQTSTVRNSSLVLILIELDLCAAFETADTLFFSKTFCSPGFQDAMFFSCSAPPPRPCSSV